MMEASFTTDIHLHLFWQGVWRGWQSGATLIQFEELSLLDLG